MLRGTGISTVLAAASVSNATILIEASKKERNARLKSGTIISALSSDQIGIIRNHETKTRSQRLLADEWGAPQTCSFQPVRLIPLPFQVQQNR
ncbi:MAG: hypothetical protein ABF824_02425 [Acetobacter sp.]